jgi:hypothetical protein
MSDLADFFDTRPRTSLSRGGARPNTGPKPKAPKVPPAPSPAEAQEEPSAYKRYEIARAEKEMHLARQAAVKADIDEGAVVSRDAVITAAAKAFAACSQSLDAIGDALEREGLPIEVCERVMELVNAAKEQLAIDLEKTHAANHP